MLFELTITKNEIEKDNLECKRKVEEFVLQIDQLADLREATVNIYENQLKEIQLNHESRERTWFNAIAEKSGVDIS